MWTPLHWILILTLILSPLISAQDKKSLGDEKKIKLPVKKGPDGRPLLFGPKIDQCQSRKYFSIFPSLTTYIHLAYIYNYARSRK